MKLINKFSSLAAACVLSVNCLAQVSQTDDIGGTLITSGKKISLTLKCVERDSQNNCSRIGADSNALQTFRVGKDLNLVDSLTFPVSVSDSIKSAFVDNGVKKVTDNHKFAGIAGTVGGFALVIVPYEYSGRKNVQGAYVGTTSTGRNVADFVVLSVGIFPGLAGLAVDVAKSPIVLTSYLISDKSVKMDREIRADILFNAKNIGSEIAVSDDQMLDFLMAIYGLSDEYFETLGLKR